MPIKTIRLCNEEACYLPIVLLGDLCSFYNLYSRILPAPVPAMRIAMRSSNASLVKPDE